MVAFAFALAFAAHAAEPTADDPFRYLEDRADPRTQEFFKAQEAHAERQFAALPGRGRLLERVRALSQAATEVTALAIAGTHVFYLRQGPGPKQPVLCMREGPSGAERVVVDPARFDRDASLAAIDWFVPAPDGRHVAYGVSRGGSEDSVLRVARTDGGGELPVEIDRARFNAGLAWHPDGRSFYYARTPAGGKGARANANTRIYRHVLGRAPEKDEIVFAPGVGGARDVPEFARPSLHVPVDSRYAWAVVRDGVRREIAVHVTEQRELGKAAPRWRKVAGIEDEVLAIEGWKDELYVLSKKNAPRHRVLRASAGAATLKGAAVVVPEGDIVVRAMGLARDALYLNTMEGGLDRLERVPIGLLGRMKNPEFLRIPLDVGISQLVTDPTVAGALLRVQGWVDEPRILRVDAKTGDSSDTRLQPPPAADFSQMDEVRLYAPGHDGTRIPVTLLYSKTTRLTGDKPTLLTGLGAYGLAQSPRFDAARLAWLERGGVYAIAHIRGGGEYGEAWHRAGQGPAKDNTILDFIAVADFLVRYGFTNPQHLAILGRGAGAIAAGGAMVRRPDLVAAVVLQAPLADMQRAELMPDGPAGIPEFGTAASARGASELAAMSTYHHVKDATAYPAMLLVAGLNDARVEPWQAAKLAARAQAATTSGRPVLLRVDPDSGNGPGNSRARREGELADIYSFVLWQFGDPQFAPATDVLPPAR